MFVALSCSWMNFFHYHSLCGLLCWCLSKALICMAQEAKTYAQENGLFFMETSAKTAINVNDVFHEIGEFRSWIISVVDFCTLTELVGYLVYKNVQSLLLLISKRICILNLISAKRLLQGQQAQDTPAGMVLNQRPAERMVSSSSCCS